MCNRCIHEHFGIGITIKFTVFTDNLCFLSGVSTVLCTGQDHCGLIKIEPAACY